VPAVITLRKGLGMRAIWRALPRRLRFGLAAAAVLIGLPTAWYLGSPLFIDVHVDEALPPPAPLGGASAQPTEALPPARPAPVPPRQVPSGSASPPAPAVREVARGEFTKIDAIHRGEGTARVLALADGRRVVRFEPFRVGNGPDLFVYLSGHPVPRSSKQLHQGLAVNLGRLKGNVGSQNYDVPAGVDLTKVRSIVIYCRAFSTVFSTAALATP
jgi:hypothetical protein